MKIIVSITVIVSTMLLSACEIKVKKISNQAEMKQDSIQASFPMETGYAKEFLVENFWKCNYDSAGDSLAYWVILPKNVKPVHIEPVAIKGTSLVNIGQYQRIDQSPYLEIWVMTENVTDNIEPADWLLKWLQSSNETILHKKEIIGSAGGKYLDVLTYKVVKDNDTSISRCTVYRSGRNYFFIKVSCSINDYEVLANKIRHISSNWGVKN